MFTATIVTICDDTDQSKVMNKVKLLFEERTEMVFASVPVARFVVIGVVTFPEAADALVIPAVPEVTLVTAGV